MDSHSDGQVIETDSWKLIVPEYVTSASPVVCIPTVHPRGDRRIVRCAQVALDAGFRVSFIWLGEGIPSQHVAVREMLLPTPKSAKERILATRNVARIAADIDAVAWHIHDYYMLRQASRWHHRTGLPVVYDVHEYYGEYYASKLPLPPFLRRILATNLDRYQARVASRIGGANLVAADMSPAFDRANAPTAVCPNYPSEDQFRSDLVRPFAERATEVIYTGSLTRSYGMDMLVALAARAHERGEKFRFRAISRFPSEEAREDFSRLLADAGNPPNLVLIDPVPSHAIPTLLSRSGFGLSLLQPSDPQFDIAVNSKNYEYSVMGIVIVATNGVALQRFVSEFAVGTTAGPANLDALLDDMNEFVVNAVETDARLQAAQIQARRRFTWEGQCGPALTGLFAEVFEEMPQVAGNGRSGGVSSNN